MANLRAWSTNKCGLGQPPKPHCYRGCSDCRLSPRRKIIAQLHSEKCHAFDAHLRLALQGYGFSAFHPPWKEDFLGGRKARAPAHWTCAEFPPVIHSRKPPATLNLYRNRFRTSHAFDCKHSAAAERLTQRQMGLRLCKNCGAEKLPVEGKENVVLLRAARLETWRALPLDNGKPERDHRSRAAVPAQTVQYAR